MLDNRLDDIPFTDTAVEKLKLIRKLFIELDKELISIGEENCIGHRALHISRNYLENSLLYAAKAIALHYELYPKGSSHERK